MFMLQFFIMFSYMVFMNGLLAKDVRFTRSIVFSAGVVIFSTVLYVFVVRNIGAQFNVALYARTLAFFSAHMLSRHIDGWIEHDDSPARNDTDPDHVADHVVSSFGSSHPKSPRN